MLLIELIKLVKNNMKKIFLPAEIVKPNNHSKMHVEV